MRDRLWLIGVALLTCVAGAEPAATRPTEGPVRHDIPPLNGVVADATGVTWRDAGFRIEAFAPVDGPIVPTSDFDALARVGWSPLGLHLLVTVVDDVVREAD